MPFVTVLLLLALETSQFLKMSFNLLYSEVFLFFPHLFFPAKLMNKRFPLGSNYTLVKNTLFFKAIVSNSILQLTVGLYSTLSLMNAHILKSLLSEICSQCKGSAFLATKVIMLGNLLFTSFGNTHGASLFCLSLMQPDYCALKFLL